jgi:Na+/phosphate symporter
MHTLLNLLAGVALLVWGTHIVRTGILKLFGGNLRRVLRSSVGHRFTAFLAGLGVASLLQSSTATALIVAAFAGQGVISTAPALAVRFGADVGTALITLVLTFDLSSLAPLLIVVVLLNGDLKSAQERLGQKVLFRDPERVYADLHLARLAGNTVENIDASSLHLDLISDLKRINSHICSIAYPILEEAGVLARTRLREPGKAIADRPDPDVARGGKSGWQRHRPHST